MKSWIVGGLFLFMTLVFGINAFTFYTYIHSLGTNVQTYIVIMNVVFALVCLAEGAFEFMGEDYAKVQR